MEALLDASSILATSIYRKGRLRATFSVYGGGGAVSPVFGNSSMRNRNAVQQHESNSKSSKKHD